jgi:hypothetical protein
MLTLMPRGISPQHRCENRLRDASVAPLAGGVLAAASPRAVPETLPGYVERLSAKPVVRAHIQELLERKQKIIEEAEKLAFHEELDARAKSKEWILNGLVELANRCMQVAPLMDRNTGKPLLMTGPDGVERQCGACR